MNIWNKILLFLIFVTAAFFAVLVSNRFKLTAQWEEKLLTQDKNLADLTSQVAQLRGAVFGDSLEESTAWEKMPLEVKMHKLESLRGGHLWIHCVSPQAPQRDGINIRTSFCLEPTSRPRQHSDMAFSQNAVAFVFDSGNPPVEDGKTADATEAAAQFLGAFTINDFHAEANEVIVTSVGAVSDMEYQRIEQSVQGGNEWFVYVDRLPYDSPDDIAEWLSGPDSKIAAVLPDAIRDFFLNRAIPADSVLAEDGESVDEIELDLNNDPTAPETAPEAVPEDTVAEDTPDDAGANTDVAENAAPDSAEAEVVLDDADGGVPAVAEASEGERYPIDYMELIQRRLLQRDVLSLAIMKHKSNLEDLRNVICDQLAAIGLPEVPEDVLAKIGPSSEEATAIAKKYVETKAATAIETKIAQKQALNKRLEAAVAERDFVQNRLELALKTVSGLQRRIDELLVSNCDLAVKIAKAQFEAADKIIKKSESVTAVNGDSTMLLLPHREI